MRARDIPARDRILAKLVEQPNGCMHWTGVIDAERYGRIGYKGRRGTPLHQAVYDCFIGPIPPGMVPDHECHNTDANCIGGRTCMHRRCGNWEHLVLRTQAQNVLTGKSFSAANRRKTHCPKGHPYDEANTYVTAGRPYCVICYMAAHNGRPPVKRITEVTRVD